MARVARRSGVELLAYTAYSGWTHPISARLRGAIAAAMGLALVAAFSTYHPTDPSLNAASGEAALNAMGAPGAGFAKRRRNVFTSAKQPNASGHGFLHRTWSANQNAA